MHETEPFSLCVFCAFSRRNGFQRSPVICCSRYSFTFSFRTQSIICVPLKSKGKVLGVVENMSYLAMPDGSRGLFSPDNFAFGQPVYLSALYAAAQGVAGVAWTRVLKFQRINDPNTAAVDSGVLEMGRQEIARLDSDPNFPEHGVFRLSLVGGK